ncbi:uncharacterized protein [Amphiura filiformis]|uniref:uncharacterized protein n=1 Tax=Amphiura filiformis TaxID=82378 RepID=UPI003B20C59B
MATELNPFGRPRRPKSRRAHHSVVNVDDVPFDPTYQYKDKRGQISSRQFVRTQQHPFHSHHNKYIVSDPESNSFCTPRQWIFILCTVAFIIILLAIAGVALVFGTVELNSQSEDSGRDAPGSTANPNVSNRPPDSGRTVAPPNPTSNRPGGDGGGSGDGGDGGGGDGSGGGGTVTPPIVETSKPITTISSGLPNEIAVEGNMALDTEFIPAYNDPNSEEYQQFTENYEEMLMRSFDGTEYEGAVRPKVTGLREGSVIVFFVVFVNIQVISVPPSSDVSTITYQISVNVRQIIIDAANNPFGPFFDIILIIINVVINIFVPDDSLAPSWNEWGAWSSCSVTCGIGNRMRTRTCSNLNDPETTCLGETYDPRLVSYYIE